MRPNNSVGGYRIYPTCPEDAESASIAVGILGQFNEGMERVHTERQLTQAQQEVANRLDPNCPLARKHQRLSSLTDDLWQVTLQKQRDNNECIATVEYTTEELAERLSRCADLWQQLKRRLDELA